MLQPRRLINASPDAIDEYQKSTMRLAIGRGPVRAGLRESDTEVPGWELRRGLLVLAERRS